MQPGYAAGFSLATDKSCICTIYPEGVGPAESHISALAESGDLGVHIPERFTISSIAATAAGMKWSPGKGGQSQRKRRVVCLTPARDTSANIPTQQLGEKGSKSYQSRAMKEQ